MVTLRGALSAAEKGLARSPAAAAGLQELHRRLFADSCGPLRQEIRRITGVEVREAAADVETGAGAVMQLFATGTVVQRSLLAASLPPACWGGTGRADPS